MEPKKIRKQAKKDGDFQSIFHFFLEKNDSIYPDMHIYAMKKSLEISQPTSRLMRAGRCGGRRSRSRRHGGGGPTSSWSCRTSPVVNVLSLLLIPLLRILHQPQHQVLRKLHDEPHLPLSLSPSLNSPSTQPPTFFSFKPFLPSMPLSGLGLGLYGPQNFLLFIEESGPPGSFVFDILLRIRVRVESK